VDDYVPVTEKYMIRNGQYVHENGVYLKEKKPVYAQSMHYGEIWPMIMEKAWAKLVGSYSAIEGGNSSWTMEHLTNDPIERFNLRAGYTATNSKGKELWDNIIGW